MPNDKFEQIDEYVTMCVKLYSEIVKDILENDRTFEKVTTYTSLLAAFEIVKNEIERIKNE